MRVPALTSNHPRVAQLHAFLAQRGYTDLRLALRAYSMGHVPMDGPSFEEGLAFLLGTGP